MRALSLSLSLFLNCVSARFFFLVCAFFFLFFFSARSFFLLFITENAHLRVSAYVSHPCFIPNASQTVYGGRQDDLFYFIFHKNKDSVVYYETFVTKSH